MSHEATYLPVIVPTGREDKCRVIAQAHPETGTTKYMLQLDPGTANMQFITLPVQNVPYQKPFTATSGISLEALYAILEDQLKIELGTTGEAKQLALTQAIRNLNESLAWVVDANSVPERPGVEDAEDD